MAHLLRHSFCYTFNRGGTDLRHILELLGKELKDGRNIRIWAIRILGVKTIIIDPAIMNDIGVPDGNIHNL